MSCSCEIPGWLQNAIVGYGVTGLLVVAFLLLVWWGKRSMQMQHAGKGLGKFLILNYASVLMFIFAAAILVAVLARKV